MKTKIDINSVYIPSDDIVAREIEGELIIVPLVAGIGDMEDDLYTLNETGKSIWAKLDGQKNLKELSEELSREFSASNDEIEEDVLGLLGELVQRKIVIEATKKRGA